MLNSKAYVYEEYKYLLTKIQVFVEEPMISLME